MATNANIGILVPGSFAGQPPTLDEYSHFFRSAEDLGFHSLWVIDRPLHKINLPHPLITLTYAAAVTYAATYASAATYTATYAYAARARKWLHSRGRPIVRVV